MRFGKNMAAIILLKQAKASGDLFLRAAASGMWKVVFRRRKIG